MTRPDHDYQDVLDRLAGLAPGDSDSPRPAAQALAELKHKLQPDQPVQHSILGRIQEMFKRKTTFTAAIVLLVILAFAFPPVRAAASDFLGLFRVRKFAPISVSPQQLRALEAIADQGLTPGELELLAEPQPVNSVTTVADAEAILGRKVRVPHSLGPADAVRATTEGHGRLTVDLESSREILAAVDVDPMLLPDSLDGAVVDVTLYPAVEQHWENRVHFVQTASPRIDYPADADPIVLGQALLQLLGMTEREAARLATEIDWNSTLLMPVPQGLASFSEIAVDGSAGMGLSDLDGSGSVLLWERGGMVYLLTSDTLTLEELRQIGNSLD